MELKFKMEKAMKENFTKEKNMDKEKLSFLMDQYMKDNLKIIKFKEKESLIH